MCVGYRSMVHAAGSEGGRGAKGFVEEALNSGWNEQESLGFISVVRSFLRVVYFAMQTPEFVNAS
jgi:hypothetical protein